MNQESLPLPESDDLPPDPLLDSAPAPRERPVAPKEYYSISEACDLVGLRPHVLRYWETQFPLLSPSKNRSGNRVYQRKEIKLILKGRDYRAFIDGQEVIKAGTPYQFTTGLVLVPFFFFLHSADISQIFWDEFEFAYMEDIDDTLVSN